MRKAFLIVIVILIAIVLVAAAYVLLRGGFVIPSTNTATSENTSTTSPGSATPTTITTSSTSPAAPVSGAPVYGSNAFQNNVAAGGSNSLSANSTSPENSGSSSSFFSTPTYGESASPAVGTQGSYTGVSGQSAKRVTVTSFPATEPSSSIPDYLGSASEILGNLPIGNTFAIGTPSGTVVVANFYTANSPVNEAGDVIIKATADYLIVYDPSSSRFWLAITGTPFATWQNVAEQDLLQTLDISEASACELYVTSGVIYSPDDPNDGLSFPLSFCGSGAFGD